MLLRTEETQRNRDREREDRPSKPIVSESSSVETKAVGSWVLEGGNPAMHLTSVIQQPSPQFYSMLGGHASGCHSTLVCGKFQSNL